MRALEGLEVVTVEQAVAAPLLSCRMADAGAHVVKVERPEGDFARGYDTAAAGQSSYFVWLNRGKESVTLDLGSAKGKAAFEALVAKADALIQNLKPGALARLGFGMDRLRRDYPRLITCSISGYGEAGPMAARKAYDLLIQAESGLCSITGGPEEPARVGVSVVDIATGNTAYSAVLEALIRRGVTGDGADIQVSMFDVIAEWSTVPLLLHEAGKTPQRIGLAHPSIAPYGMFPTASGTPILISIQSDREWRDLCEQVLEAPDRACDPRFATNAARVENRGETDALVAGVLGGMEPADAVARLDAAKIAVATVKDMEGLRCHPHLRRTTVETPNGPVSVPAPAPIVDGEVRSYGPVPALKPLEESDAG